MPKIDFEQRYSDYARFLPAVSEMYTRFVTNQNPKRVSPIPQADLDFFNPNTNLWYLPCSLFSAGQAAKSEGASKRKDMLTGRTNKNTTIVGDSGGFQIQQGSIKFKGDVTRERMMRWLEDNCDWGMILDFPTGGVNMGTIDPHYERLKADGDIYVHQGKPYKIDDFITQVCGYKLDKPQERGVGTCLFQTLVNNDYFIKNRRPVEEGTRFLNVIQGRDEAESSKWYEHVKHYKFEGWSLAGPHKEKFEITLARLLDMRRDGLLEGKNWMHILGVGKLQNGAAYTTMQRMIRKHDNPDFTISYDVSSPFTTAAFGNLFLGYTLDRSGWTIQSDKLDGRHYLEKYPKFKERFNTRFSEARMGEGKGKILTQEYRGDEMFLDELRILWDNFFATREEGMRLAGVFEGEAEERYVNNSKFVETEIGKRIRMKDLCVNPQRRMTSTWDVVTYAMLMNHNVQVHLEAVFESQDMYDRGDVDRVPMDMLFLKEAIEEILDPATKDPYTLIRNNRDLLNCLSGDKQEAVVEHGALNVAGVREHATSVDNLYRITRAKTVKPTISLEAFV